MHRVQRAPLQSWQPVRCVHHQGARRTAAGCHIAKGSASSCSAASAGASHYSCSTNACRRAYTAPEHTSYLAIQVIIVIVASCCCSCRDRLQRLVRDKAAYKQQADTCKSSAALLCRLCGKTWMQHGGGAPLAVAGLCCTAGSSTALLPYNSANSSSSMCCYVGQLLAAVCACASATAAGSSSTSSRVGGSSYCSAQPGF
jgi:hypothetical protein